MKKEIVPSTVADVMSRDLITVGLKTELKTIKRIFEERDFNGLPVVDDDGKLVGMVTKLDLLRLFRPDKRSWVPDFSHMDARCVEDILGEGVAAVHPDDPITTAVDRMIDLNVRSLPVIEREGKPPRLVGVVTRKDVLKSLEFRD